MINVFTAGATRRSWLLWRIEWHIFRQLWFSRIAWTFGEPVLYAVLFGLGFEPFIPTMRGVTYLQFLAPGLLIGYSMYTACFECTYNTYSHLTDQQWYDALLATPLTAEDIAGGTILWGTTRGCIIGFGMFLFCALVGAIQSAWVWLTLPIVVMTAMTFAGMGVWLSSYVKSFDHFNYLWGFFIAPAFIVTGIFFPVDALPVWMRAVGYLFPTNYVVEPLRHAMVGSLTWSDGGHLMCMAGITWLWWQLGVRALSRRLVA